jgi:hypothetical protein
MRTTMTLAVCALIMLLACLALAPAAARQLEDFPPAENTYSGISPHLRRHARHVYGAALQQLALASDEDCAPIKGHVV